MSRHFRFISRTVFVKNNEIDDALNSINRFGFDVMSRNGFSVKRMSIKMIIDSYNITQYEVIRHIHASPLTRLMRNEKISDAIRRNQYYITPCERRQQVDRERAKRLYGSGMAKRVNFLMRKSRPNPFPR